jgi:hypothetical protein
MLARFFVKLLFPNILMWGVIEASSHVTDVVVLLLFWAEVYNVR